MALRLNEEHQLTGSGLGYQMSCYALMRALCNRSGFKYSVGKFELLALKNTFETLKIDEETENSDNVGAADIKDTIESGELIEFLDDEQFEDVLTKVKDDVPLFGYPTPINAIDTTQITDLKKDFTYRGEIQDICKEWKKKNFGDTSLISMHVRRGDFTDIQSGMFLIDDDYYIDALKQLPELPVLIFTNDKDYILNNKLWQSDRFTLITDLTNDNNMVDCEWTQMIDDVIDESGMGRFYYKMALMLVSQRTGVPVANIISEMHPHGKKKIKNNWYNYSFDHCMMHLCDYHIMANSTYGLWGVEMSNSKKVVYPKYWMQGLHEDKEAKVCKDPESCRPGFRCNQDDSIALDLGGFDQTATIAGHFKNDTWVGLDNPDQRGFTIVK